ncbi:MAG: CBS domain-containing protein [Planctomycetota bacterium]|jgi:CBS domain-containing protein
MLVGAIMSGSPVTVRGDHTVLHVAHLMQEKDVGAVVVLDDNGQAIGIVTDRDITCRTFGSKDMNPGTIPVDEVMSRPAVTAGEDTLIFDLLRNMAELRIRRMPIVDSEEKVIGMVSMDDIILLLTTELANVAEVLGSASRVLGDDPAGRTSGA